MYFDGICDMGELKTRWHELAQEFHPDKGGDVATMQAINAEYQEALARASASLLPVPVAKPAPPVRERKPSDSEPKKRRAAPKKKRSNRSERHKDELIDQLFDLGITGLRFIRDKIKERPER